jgi:hypothetical protein
VDIVRRPQRAKLDLDELRRCEFEFIFGFAGTIAAFALAETADGIDRELLLTLQPDAGAGGEAEDVLGFDVAPGGVVVRPSGAALHHDTGH